MVRGTAPAKAPNHDGVELLFIKQESRPGNTPIAVFEIDEGGIDDMVSELAGKGVTIVTPAGRLVGGVQGSGRAYPFHVSVSG